MSFNKDSIDTTHQAVNSHENQQAIHSSNKSKYHDLTCATHDSPEDITSFHYPEDNAVSQSKVSLNHNVEQSSGSTSDNSSWTLPLSFSGGSLSPFFHSFQPSAPLLHNDHPMLTRAKTRKSKAKVFIAQTHVEPISATHALSIP